jgi:APA family basic amino acid/polyamine antiporter
MESVSGKENLKREIGVRALTLAILNITVGTGIFVIPAIIAAHLGASAILAYVVCGILIFLIALCFAEVGSNTAASGGVYTYIETAFGPYAGFLANNIYWVGGCVFADAAIANGLADTMKYFFPVFGNEIFRALFFLFLFGALAFLNIRSVKNGIRLIEFTSAGKLIPLIILVIAGAGSISTVNLKWISAPAITSIGSASLLLFFAFLGFEGPLSNGGEIKNAKRTVPLAIFLGISLVLILYMSIQLVTQGILGSAISTHKDAPLAAVAGIVFGKAGAIFIFVATAISMLGAVAGDVLSIPRILFAGARDKLMPKPLAKVYPRFFTPHVAVLFYAVLDFVFSVTGEFKQLATLASASILIIYFGVALSTLKLRRRNSSSTEKTFRVPGGIIVPLLAASAIIWLLSNLTKPELIGCAIFIVVFSVIYFFMQLVKKKGSAENI